MKKTVNREKYIHSYLNNKYMEIETDKKKIIESKFSFIIIYILCMLFITVSVTKYKRIDVCTLLIFIGIGLIIYLTIKYDNWKLKLENNTIYIERKIFLSHIINADDLIKVQHYINHYRKDYREYIEITYFNKKNKIKMDRLYICKNINYFVEEDKIKEFIKIFSDYPENLEEHNSDIKEIKRSDEQIKKIYKKDSFIKKMNSPVNIFFSKVFTIIRFCNSRNYYSKSVNKAFL